MPRICVIGDSIVHGENDLEAGGWVTRLKRYYLSTGKLRQVYNLGISGRNSKDFILRFENEIAARMSSTNELVAAIVGASDNDASYRPSLGKHQVSIDELKEILPQFKEITDKLKTRLIFVGMVNTGNDGKTSLLPFDDDYFLNIKDVEKYDNVIKEYCIENNILFIDLFGLMERDDLEDDLIHPNARGHKKIFQKVKDELIKNKIISV